MFTLLPFKNDDFTMKTLGLLACLFCFPGGAYAAEGLIENYRNGPYIHYQGTGTVSGTFSRNTDRERLEFFIDMLCFQTDKASARLIPVNPVNGTANETPAFCFSNTKEAMRLLKVPRKISNRNCGYQGKATVTITGFVADLEETATFDMARLVRVISTTKPEPIFCKNRRRNDLP